MVDTGTLNILSLCSGIGGIELGLRLAVPRTRTVCYVEGEAFCCAVLASAMEAGRLDTAPVWSDVRTFKGAPWRRVVDLVTGGYPCQPFSHAGKRAGKADARHLWPHIARIVGEVQPGMCFWENVPGHLTLGFDTVASDLEAMDYRIAAGLFTASEAGAPHKRERLFILADRNSRRQPEHTQCDSKPLDNGPSQRNDTLRCGMGNTQGINERGGPGHKAKRHEPEQQCTDKRASWPPGPASVRWRSVEPYLCPVADGVPDRVDQLRALGNSVVPLVAAHAFVTLWAVLHRND